MSQNHQSTNQGGGQSNVRVIPIFVEGRDEPVINKDITDSSSSSSIPSQDMPRMAADFGAEIPSFKHGSIFDRAKEFPVRNFPSASEFFNRANSPSRGESPARTVPINHINEPAFQPPPHFTQFHPAQQMPRRQPSPQSPQYQQQAPHYPMKQARSRTSSRNSEEPPIPQTHQTQRQGTPSMNHEFRQASPAPQMQQEIPKQAEELPPKPLKEGPIEKIQKIQKDVLNLMTAVEHFKGKNKKDREYLYLDEMLTQNLLKLDNVETEGKENVKLARKEAIKCINRCLSVLEAKAEANDYEKNEQDANELQQRSSSSDTMQANNSQPNTGADNNQQNTENTTNSMQEQMQNEQTQPSKESSRSSIYDNHDPNAPDNEMQQSRSKEATPQPSQLKAGSKESSPAYNHDHGRDNTPPKDGIVPAQKSNSASSQK